jgi:hypothetical protein
VAGRFERLEPDASELDAIAGLQRRECVLGLRGGAQVDRRAGPVAQFQVSGEEVGVEVRKEYVRDAQVVLVGQGQILIDVPLRIDNRRDAAAFVADEIRRVRQAVQVKLMEDQIESPRAMEKYTR